VRITVLTLFPEVFPGVLGVSLLGKALVQGIWTLDIVNLREYGIGPHKTVDDACYGGGAGMVLRPDVIHHALLEKASEKDKALFLYMTPRGIPLQQHHLAHWKTAAHIVILCGRYEGVDERVLQWWGFQEISLGDFVLCGGEIPAMALIEGLVRLIPGVVGNETSLVTESFENHLLEHPQYTRPFTWQDMTVPDVLVSGHHHNIQVWKNQHSCQITQQRRPDLWEKFCQKNRVDQSSSFLTK
jgi:tRNA (guanine37-N1)-methyltransferase